MGRAAFHGLTTGIFGDVNGDGLPDFEEAVGLDEHGLVGDLAYLGNGQLWDGATTTVFGPMKELPVGTPTVTNPQLIDVNGDGLADWVYSDSGNTYVLLNTGTGWESTPSSQWTIATSTLYPARFKSGAILSGPRLEFSNLGFCGKLLKIRLVRGSF